MIAHTGRATDSGTRSTATWADLLWPYRGDNDIVDDEFMRYFDFLIEVCEWREDRIRGDEPTPTRAAARRSSARTTPASGAPRVHLRGVRRLGRRAGPSRPPSPRSSPRRRPRRGSGSSAPRHVTCSTPAASGTATRGTTRAVLTHRHPAALRHPRPPDPRDRGRRARLRSSATSTRLRSSRCASRTCRSSSPRSTSSCGAGTSTPGHLQPEPGGRRARASASSSPSTRAAAGLSRLEDHSILRGTLAAFDLEPPRSRTRAAAFEAAFAPEHWPALTGALLATGEYQRDYPDSDHHRSAPRPPRACGGCSWWTAATARPRA